MPNNPKSSAPNRVWHFINAENRVLGRLATEVAVLLRGKHKTLFRRHIDAGDIVVITNAAKVVLTGHKESDKLYYRHSGYPGGLKTTNVAKLRLSNPSSIIVSAISGMLPKTRMRDDMLKRLKVYSGPEHPHTANVKNEKQLKDDNE